MISDEMIGAETASEQVVSAPVASSQEDASAETPKKRVGRPRKKPVAAEAADAPEKGEPQQEEPAPAKRVVRKKSSAAEKPEETTEEKPAPRRRTRRNVKEETVDAAQAPSAATDGQSEAASADEGVARKRTSSRSVSRYRKAAATDGESASQEDSSRAENAAISDESAPSAKESVSDKASSGDGAENSEAPAKPALRKRPGRSTKLRMAVEASESAAAEDGKDSSDGESADEKPVRRRNARKAASSPEKEESADRAEDERHDDASNRDDDQAEKESRSEKSSESSDEAHDKHSRRDRESRQPRDRRQNQRDRRQGGKQFQQNRDHEKDRSRNDRNDRNDRNNDQHRRQRRNHVQTREPMVPKTTVEELSKLKVAELREKAAELDLDVTGLKKAELVEKVYEAAVRAEGFIEVEGILDVLQDGYGFLRTKGYLPCENDVYVGLSTIRRNGLRKGDYVKGQTRPARENEKYAALQQVVSVNGTPIEEQGERVRFGDLTPVFPDECLVMEHGKNTITARVIDLVSPIGKGQRGLIVSPPKAGKTTVLKDIAAAITANNPEVHLMCLLVDERPEEVTDMQRSIKGEVIASTFDMPTENHIAVSELVIERAKRLVERGEDVVVLLDSLTRLARAYNLAQPASGRILSGGVDSTALYPPKRFLGAARNIEGGGSLTILASALIETGSKMDEVIFEEFKGTGNMELKLDRSLADRRVFPAIDPVASGTRREDLLLNQQEAPLIWAVRRILSNMNSTERAMDMLIKSLKQTNDNQEFLLRTAKKAQGNRDSDNMEL